MTTHKLTAIEHSPYLQEAYTSPWNYGFTSLTRWFSARYQASDAIGKTKRPHQDKIRFGQHPTLAFSPREIANIRLQDGKLKIEHYGLGLWGANGPLPLHYSEIAMHRKEMVHDQTLTNFVDIFHHRSISLFYRAWAINQSTAGIDNPNDERFSRYIAWLSGEELDEIDTLSIPRHARLSASATSISQSKSPDALTKTLSHYFGVPFEINEYHFHWIAMEKGDQTRLGIINPDNPYANQLGMGAMLGAHIPDCQHAFLLRVGPLSLNKYLHFLPNGKYFKQIKDWVRTFVGFEYTWFMQLTIDPDQVQPMQLGGQQRLGWDAWMGHAPVNHNVVTGMTLEPETYP